MNPLRKEKSPFYLVESRNRGDFIPMTPEPISFFEDRSLTISIIFGSNRSSCFRVFLNTSRTIIVKEHSQCFAGKECFYQKQSIIEIIFSKKFYQFAIFITGPVHVFYCVNFMLLESSFLKRISMLSSSKIFMN